MYRDAGVRVHFAITVIMIDLSNFSSRSKGRVYSSREKKTKSDGTQLSGSGSLWSLINKTKI